jgi:quinol monooxygenase YgiN
MIVIEGTVRIPPGRRDALAAHFKTAHMATWRSFFPVLGIEDRSLRLYEADPEPM